MTVVSPADGGISAQAAPGAARQLLGVLSPPLLSLQRKAVDAASTARPSLDQWKPFAEDELARHTPSLSLRAPLDDDDGSDRHLVPIEQGFHITAPTGWTDDDDSDIDTFEKISTPSCHRPGTLLNASTVNAAQHYAQARVDLERQIQSVTAERLRRFYLALDEFEAEEAVRATERASAAEAASAAEEASAAAAEERRASSRAKLLSSLRSGHAKVAEQAAQKLAEAARARAAAIEAKQRHEEERRAAAAREAEQKAKETARLKEEEKLRQTAASQAKQEAEQRAKAVAEKAKSPAKGVIPSTDQAGSAPSTSPTQPAVEWRCSPSALAWRQELGEILSRARAEVAPYKADAGTKAARRAVDKALTLNVQQISASREQVFKKSAALRSLLQAQPPGPPALYAQLQLAAKFCVQCEVQVTRLPGFAFPLAEVAVGVCVGVPGFVELLVAQLAALCPLCVPALAQSRAGAEDDEEALKMQGYKIRQDTDSGQTTRESTDEYLARMGAMVRFYAALMQCDEPQNPHGLKQAWTWLARFLNGVPPAHASAAALNAFLHVGGWRLQRAYRQQAMKLFQAAQAQWLPQLARLDDPDIRADLTRIQAYFEGGEWNKEPEGRALPAVDASSYDRA